MLPPVGGLFRKGSGWQAERGESCDGGQAVGIDRDFDGLFAEFGFRVTGREDV
jgi:hypothetical protein